jgi:hypothetical protein
MTRLAVLAVAACLIAAAFASPASAATFHKCPMPDDYTLTKVKHVSCKRADKILARYFNGETNPSGWTCKQKQYEGGATTKCRKGIKRIKHYVAD